MKKIFFLFLSMSILVSNVCAMYNCSFSWESKEDFQNIFNFFVKYKHLSSDSAIIREGLQGEFVHGFVAAKNDPAFPSVLDRVNRSHDPFFNDSLYNFKVEWLMQEESDKSFTKNTLIVLNNYAFVLIKCTRPASSSSCSKRYGWQFFWEYHNNTTDNGRSLYGQQKLNPSVDPEKAFAALFEIFTFVLDKNYF